MWYEADESHFVRAETPPGFDEMVQRLEDADSVLFESVTLPSVSALIAKQDAVASPSLEPEIAVPRIEVETAQMEFSDDFEDTDTQELAEDDLTVLKSLLADLKLEGTRKAKIIASKDSQIASLQRELAQLEARKGRVGFPNRSFRESADFYKSQYEKTLADLEMLKKSLSDDGRLKRVSARSARAIKLV
jgi:hypothetical protein